MDDDPVVTIERSMVAIRRSQSRRALARLTHGDEAGPAPGSAVFEVIDVVEVAEQAGEPALVSTVATALGVDQPRASRLVAAAVEAGLLERRADQADGRRSLLTRTPAGVALSEQVHDVRRSAIATATGEWSAADRATFARLLGRFVGDWGRVTR